MNIQTERLHTYVDYDVLRLTTHDVNEEDLQATTVLAYICNN